MWVGGSSPGSHVTSPHCPGVRQQWPCQAAQTNAICQRGRALGQWLTGQLRGPPPPLCPPSVPPPARHRPRGRRVLQPRRPTPPGLRVEREGGPSVHGVHDRTQDHLRGLAGEQRLAAAPRPPALGRPPARRPRPAPAIPRPTPAHPHPHPSPPAHAPRPRPPPPPPRDRPRAPAPLPSPGTPPCAPHPPPRPRPCDVPPPESRAAATAEAGHAGHAGQTVAQVRRAAALGSGWGTDLRCIRTRRPTTPEYPLPL